MNKVKKILISFAILGMIAGCSPVPDSSSGSGPVTLRIGTWNIASQKHPDPQAMAAVLDKHRLDAVGIQEVDVQNNRNSQDLAQAFVNDDDPYVHFAKGRDFADGAFGIGVVSQHELLQVSSIPLESTGSRATKTLERVVIEKDGVQIALYNTHLSWENLDLRRRQIAQVIQRVNADPMEYKVITGDFNTDQHEYEYSMFLDNFNVANGYKSMWYDTYREADDPSMNVFTIDNVLCTKNMRITDIQRVESDLSDHDLFYAEFELLGEVEGLANSDNRALGQNVIVSSLNEEISPYLLVDYDTKTPWVSDAADQQFITIELDRVYAVDQINVLWDTVKAKQYLVSGSLDGESYQTLAEIQDVKDSDAIAVNNQPVKFVRLELSGKKAANQGYEITEIQIFGDPLSPQIDSANRLPQGSFEVWNGNQPEGWNWTVVQAEEHSGSAAFVLSADTAAKTAGSSSLMLTQSGIRSGIDGVLSTSAAVKPNTTYQLVFDHRAQQLSSTDFTIEMTQKTANGESISTHQVTLNDNLCMSEEWAAYSLNFVTAYSADSLDLSFRLSGAEGTLWLDDVQIREAVPTENIFLKTEAAALKVGDKTTVTGERLPKEASDVTLHWFSSDERVAVVDEQGQVTAVKPGKAYIGLCSGSELRVESSLLVTVEE